MNTHPADYKGKPVLITQPGHQYDNCRGVVEGVSLNPVTQEPDAVFVRVGLYGNPELNPVTRVVTFQLALF